MLCFILLFAALTDNPVREVSAEEASRLRLSPFEIVYPPLARQAGIMGFVQVRVFVDPEGRVEDVQTVSGHPLLVRSVADVLRKQYFHSMIENGEPIRFSYVHRVTFEFRDAPEPVRRAVVPAARQPRKECRWRDEEVDRALECLRALDEKSTEEMLAWARLERWQGREEEALQVLERGLPGTKEAYLELAETLGQFEEARKKLP